MFTLKTALITAVSALGLFAAAPAQAQSYYAPYYAPAGVSFRYRGPRFHRVRVVRRPMYAPPAYQPSPMSYTYTQPVYEQSAYDDGSNAFAAHVRWELGNIESQVRDRVAAGELDGSALTTMEAARNDLQEDLVDLSAKGYIAAADRAHLESDLQQLRQKFGC
jgi:hypothetical protein